MIPLGEPDCQTTLSDHAIGQRAYSYNGMISPLTGAPRSQQKKGPQVCTGRPKSREETPKKGMQGIAASQGGIWQCDMDFARGASAEFCTGGQNLHEDCRRVMCK